MHTEEDSQKKEKQRIKFSKEASDRLIQVIEDYINLRFGSMNKNDFEVLIFNAILNSNLEEVSDYRLSRVLKIPESKVKRLKYEADLVYNEAGSNDRLKVLEQVLKKARFKGVEGKIQLWVEDNSMKSFIKNILEERGSGFDSSFNSSIIIMDFKDLLYIYQEFDEYNEELEKVLDYAHKVISSEITVEGLFNGLFNGITTEGATLKESALGFTINAIKLLVKKFNKQSYYEQANALK